MYHIAVLTNSETQEAFYIEQLSRFCFERGLFPKMDCYRGQELFFDVARVNAPTCTVIALPGVEGLNAVEHLRTLFPKHASSGAAIWIFPACISAACRLFSVRANNRRSVSARTFYMVRWEKTSALFRTAHNKHNNEEDY